MPLTPEATNEFKNQAVDENVQQTQEKIKTTQLAGLEREEIKMSDSQDNKESHFSKLVEFRWEDKRVTRRNRFSLAELEREEIKMSDSQDNKESHFLKLVEFRLENERVTRRENFLPPSKKRKYENQ